MFSRSRGRTRSCGGWARERPLFVFMGFQLPAFFIESFYQNWPAVGLKESLLICRDRVLPVGRPIFDYSWSGLAAWYLKAIDAASIRDFHLVVHDIGGPIGFDVIRRVPDRIKSLTVLNTLVDVSQFKRPWVMEPFAWPVIGRLWLQSARTPMFYVLIKTYGTPNINRAEADAYGQLLLGPDSGRAFLQIMRSFERTPAFEQGIKAALKVRKFPAQIIWGKDDPALRMKKYAPHLLKALDLESYEAVHGKHFLQEDSSRAIASLIARLISGLSSSVE